MAQVAGSSTEPPQTSPTVPEIPWRGGAWASAVAAAYLALSEVNGLLGQVLDYDTGRTWNPTALTAPVFTPGKAAERADGWRFLFGTEVAGVSGWLLAYALLDALLIVLYGTWLLTRVRRERIAAAATPARPVARAAWLLVVVGIVADVAESVLVGTTTGPSVLPWVSLIKWLGLAGGLVAWFVSRAARDATWLPAVRRGAGRLRHALYTHRYSLVVVLPLALFGLAKGPAVIEQVPDIQRRWVDEQEWGSLLFAGLVSGALLVAILVIGRQRTHHVWMRSLPTPREAAPPPPLWVWVVPPLVLAVLRFVLGDPGWDATWLFFLIPLAVAAVSATVRWRHFGWRLSGLRWRPPEQERLAAWRAARPTRPAMADHAGRYRRTAVVGDTLVVLLVVVFALGAVRSFTAVVALGPVGVDPGLWPLVAVIGGALSAVLAWPVAAWLLARLRGRVAALAPEALADSWLAALTPGIEPARRRLPGTRWTLPPTWLSWTLMTLALAVVVVLSVWVEPLSRWAGVIGAFTLSLGCVAIVVAGVVCGLQPTGSPEALWFRPVRVAFVPVTSLLVAAMLTVGVLGSGSSGHDLRRTAAAAGERPTVEEAWTDWRDDGGCVATVDVGGTSVGVRPLLLYAAEGGGIRAAYWTSAVLDRVRSAAPGCPAFLATGASGGAVGLSVSAVSDDGGAATQVDAIAGQDALTAASVGLVLRDPLDAAGGVPLPVAGGGEAPWVDRAGLIERAWERDVPRLTEPFVVPRGSQSSATGYLVLNSTSATTLCRTLVSQLDVDGGEPRPCGPVGTTPGSTDLLECVTGLSRATAALLASRFPYVTPSGVVPGGTEDDDPCREQQLVDGGYADNSGLGTMLDLADQWLPLVRDHNATQLRALATGRAAAPLVLPVLVYLDNGSGSDVATAPRGRSLEFLVPPLTFGARFTLSSPGTYLQRASDELSVAHVLPATGVLEREWRRALVARLAAYPPVHVVHQPTRPSIASPLGWVLSGTSRDAMDAALDVDPRPLDPCLGTLCTLLARLGGDWDVAGAAECPAP